MSKLFGHVQLHNSYRWSVFVSCSGSLLDDLDARVLGTVKELHSRQKLVLCIDGTTISGRKTVIGTSAVPACQDGTAAAKPVLVDLHVMGMETSTGDNLGAHCINVSACSLVGVRLAATDIESTIMS